MAANVCDVEVTWSLDVPNLQKRMDGVVIRVFRSHRGKVLADIRKRWRGWVYKGRPLSKRNISLGAWEGTVQSTEHPYSLDIKNEARSIYGGKPYVAYVHRAGSTEQEAGVVFEAIKGGALQLLQSEMTAAILTELGKPGPVKRRRINKPSETVRLIAT